MTAKRFNVIDIQVVDEPTLLLTGAPDYDTSVVVNFVNRNQTSVLVSLIYASSTLADITDADYLIYQKEIEPNNYFKTDAIAVESGLSLYVTSDTTLVNVIAYGFEEEQ